MNHIESLQYLHKWLLKADYDIQLPKEVEDPLDTATHIQCLEDQLQEYERAMQKAMDIFGSLASGIEESRLMYHALSEVYGDKSL